MSERWRLFLETIGAALVILAVMMLSVALGILVAGIILIVAANFYGNEVEDDADPVERQ